MRERWKTINSLWEVNKALANNLNLLDQLDYMGKLSSQLQWQQDAGNRPVRVVYTKSGEPTAALLQDNGTLVDHLLYWVTCKDMNEANYLLAVINSDALQDAVHPLMSKGQFGARDLHKHLWKLPIPAFDPAQELHAATAETGATAARAAKVRLTALRAWCEREEKELTVALARRELRRWLRTSPEGTAVETAVQRLLAGE